MMNDWKEMLETETIATLGEFAVNSKTVLLFSGESMAGKTIACLHLVDSAIRNGHKVLYFDTDEKKMLTKPEPNLFKDFYSKSKEEYESLFMYCDILDYNKLLDTLERKKPKLLVIDSVYQPFFSSVANTRTRAIEIKNFLTKLRPYLLKNNMGCIITTPVGRIVNPTTKEEDSSPLGGKAVKYLSDTRIMIKFIGEQDSDNTTADSRLFIVDRQHQFGFHIKYGGHLVPIMQK